MAFLKKSSAGDLVLERDMTLEGDLSRGRPVEPEAHRLWQRAAPGHAMTRAEFENRLGPRPDDYFMYAQNLLDHKLNQDAAKWFYIGKLRAAVYRSLHPQTGPNAPNYLRMKDGVAHKLEYFCEQHPLEWRQLIDAAIAWDNYHPQINGLTPAQVFAAEAEQRASFLQTQQAIDAHPTPQAGWHLSELLR